MVNIINKKKAVVISIIDFFVRILFYFYIIISLKFIRKNKKDIIKKILIINSGYLGDSILNVPMIMAIRNRYKDSKISMLINPKFSDLWIDFKEVDNLIIYDSPWIRYGYKIRVRDIIDYIKFIKDIRKKKFDMIIDSRGDFRNNFLLLYNSKAWKRVGFGLTGGSYFLTDKIKWKYQHEVENSLEIAKYLGCDIKEKMPRLNISTKKVRLPKGKKIVIAPGAGYPTKELSIKKWVELIDKIKNNIILTGSLKDINFSKIIDLVKDKSKITNLIGKLDLKELAYVINQSDLLISPDSGSAHLASALGTKTITLFGPTDEIRWKPYGKEENNILIKSRVKCSPCGLLYNCQYNYKCVKDINIEEILKNIKKLI
jgi:ADP-heptose:LPS heptosyltransferase